MKKLTLLGFICLALMLTALPFAACAEPTPPAPPAAPTVITPTPAVVTPSPTPPVTPVTPTPVTPTPVTPVGPVTPVTPAPAPVVVTAPAGEPVYTVLDPRSYQEPWEYQGLTPRLDTLDGKTVIVVNLHGGNEEAIKSVGPALQAAVPACNVISREAHGYGDMSNDDWNAVMESDAVIFGHDY